MKEGEKSVTREVVKEFSKEQLKQDFIDLGKTAITTIIKKEVTLALNRQINSNLKKFRGSVEKDASKEIAAVLADSEV